MNLIKTLKDYGFYDKLERHGFIQYLENTKLEINPRLSRTYGLAYGTKNKIEIAGRIKDNRVQFSDTLIHEVGHIVCDKKYKKNCKHGKEWKKFMELMGAVPRMCSSVGAEKAYANRQKKGVIETLVETNPHKPDSYAYSVYEKCREFHGKSVDEYIASGGKLVDINYETKKGFIRINYI